MGPDTQNIDSTRNATHPTESRSRMPRTFRLADQACEYCRRFSDDLIDETRRIAITSPGARAFLDAFARYHPMNTGVFTLAIARRPGVFVFPPQAICAAYDAPMDSRSDHALSFCSRGPVSRGHRHGSLMHALSGALRDANLCSEREKCGLFPDTQGMPNHDRPADLYVASPDACEGAGTDWLAAAIDVTVVSWFTETRERSRPCSHPRGRPDMRLLSLRPARHPPFSTERRTYTSCSR
jgi:hypothetical protein